MLASSLLTGELRQNSFKRASNHSFMFFFLYVTFVVWRTCHGVTHGHKRIVKKEHATLNVRFTRRISSEFHHDIAVLSHTIDYRRYMKCFLPLPNGRHWPLVQSGVFHLFCLTTRPLAGSSCDRTFVSCVISKISASS